MDLYDFFHGLYFAFLFIALLCVLPIIILIVLAAMVFFYWVENN